MKMFLATMISGPISFFIMLGYEVNVFMAGSISLALLTLAASIITKLDFGSWNPF